MENNIIEEIKKVFEDKSNLVDSELKDKFSEDMSKILSKDLELAKFFLNCYDTINLNLDEIENEEFIKYFDNNLVLNDNLRSEFNNYEDGNGFEDWIAEERIKKIVNLNRKEIIKFLDVFNKIFIEN